MESTIFTIVMVILIIVVLYWIYLDQSENTRPRSELRENAYIIGLSPIHEYHDPILEKKSSGVAVIASFFIPGLGQIYNGQILKGILFIILHVLSILIGIILIVDGAFTANGTAIMAGIALYPIFWIYNLYDAYKTAERTHLQQVYSR